jgi:hypothetical protein
MTFGFAKTKSRTSSKYLVRQIVNSTFVALTFTKVKTVIDFNLEPYRSLGSCGK